MRLCGISSRFQLLSPCMRQVTHALLTRPPLSHKIFISEENQIECFVRLACVKHAASVHPEPGSNSHVKSFFLPELIWQLIRNNVLIYCFKVASLIEAFLNYSQNLSRFFTVQLSMFVVVISNSLYILSYLQVVVNNFFYFSLLSFFRGNSDILSCLSLFVNNFFSAIYSVGAQYHLALSDQNCSARVSFVIIPPSSNFVNQKLQIKLYSDNLCCILKLLYHAFYFSHNTRNSYNIAYA